MSGERMKVPTLGKQTGGQLQKQIVTLAHTFGWKIAHFRSVPVQRGDRTVWQTPVAADGVGFPDLVLLHPTKGEAYFREIKGDYETVRPEQEQWGAWILGAGLDWAIWRPRQWEREIVPLLTFGRGDPQ